MTTLILNNRLRRNGAENDQTSPKVKKYFLLLRI